MTKHNQTKSLGPLTNFQSAPEPKPETTEQRVDQLERRLTQAEVLLNDVMQQLDKPYRETPQNNGKPKQAKQAKTQQTQSKQAKPSKPKTKKKAPTPAAPATTEEQKQADTAAVIAFLHQHPRQQHPRQPKNKNKRTPQLLSHFYISTPIASGTVGSCESQPKNTAV